MQELKYLKDKKKTPGLESFITNVAFPMEHGSADIQLYDIFPGVQLMVTDYKSETCIQRNAEQDAISINHCCSGRFECLFNNRTSLYMGEGDIAINNMMHSPIEASFPLKYYFGSTIILYPEICETVPELRAFGISTGAISDKYSLAAQCRVFRRNDAIQHVYNELYAHLERPELPFLRIKIIELLYHFQARQTVFEENQEYLPKVLTEKIKHVKEHLVENLEHHISLKELAAEHDISLTQLKTGFKQIYGAAPYAYLRNYKMHVAASRLIQTEHKILEIAADLGYQNPSKFTEAFCSVMGMTPHEYRKKHK